MPLLDLLSPEELDAALAEQERSGRPLRDVLLDAPAEPPTRQAPAGEPRPETGIPAEPQVEMLRLEEARVRLAEERRRLDETQRRLNEEQAGRPTELTQSRPSYDAEPATAAELAASSFDRGPRRIGELLLLKGAITEQELDDALADQGESGRRLGEILVRAGLVSRPALGDALVEQRLGELVTESGFGSGLREAIDTLHRRRRGQRPRREPSAGR
ncbi:MAG TPA: hypothetical protein VFW80_02695 [Gaiellaceae bacterium]|nr:hypothetical protein [Gaiellaceae bacterium]